MDVACRESFIGWRMSLVAGMQVRAVQRRFPSERFATPWGSLSAKRAEWVTSGSKAVGVPLISTTPVACYPGLHSSLLRTKIWLARPRLGAVVRLATRKAELPFSLSGWAIASSPQSDRSKRCSGTVPLATCESRGTVSCALSPADRYPGSRHVVDGASPRMCNIGKRRS